MKYIPPSLVERGSVLGISAWRSELEKEDVLYYASKRAYEVDKKSRNQSGLRKLIGQMQRDGLIMQRSRNLFKRYYSITPEGEEKLAEYQAVYRSKENEPE